MQFIYVDIFLIYNWEIDNFIGVAFAEILFGKLKKKTIDKKMT